MARPAYAPAPKTPEADRTEAPRSPRGAVATADARVLQQRAAAAFAPEIVDWSLRRRLALVVGASALLWAAIGVAGWMALAA